MVSPFASLTNSALYFAVSTASRTVPTSGSSVTTVSPLAVTVFFCPFVFFASEVQLMNTPSDAIPIKTVPAS
ncbi:hypothetical protein D3C71_1787030 [compost metagenome]